MRTNLLLWCLLFFPVLFVSCDEEEDGNVRKKFNIEELRTNRAAWDKLNLQNYTYEYSNSGYSYSGIASRIKVDVSNGNEVVPTALVENGIQDADQFVIDSLFAQIEAKYTNDLLHEETGEVYLKEIKVLYDENYFYPKEIHYIMHMPEEMVGIWNMHQYIKAFDSKD
ncbi:hypothetical protein BZG02_15955 [Labilibaculum filiforme]|uniref:Uncharacterized protein n=2 Tax=Labilibaculum filiforme TaxID=1940526 RepID=A0A2N3HTS0_9BACT|nr:hypothetical protein BZG02_15955 [Labilibaculum filiforme]